MPVTAVAAVGCHPDRGRICPRECGAGIPVARAYHAKRLCPGFPAVVRVWHARHQIQRVVDGDRPGAQAPGAQAMTSHDNDHYIIDLPTTPTQKEIPMKQRLFLTLLLTSLVLVVLPDVTFAEVRLPNWANAGNL